MIVRLYFGFAAYQAWPPLRLEPWATAATAPPHTQIPPFRLR